MNPACSFARQTKAFSVRGRPKSIFMGGFIIKCLRDEQRRPAESQGASRKRPCRAPARGLRQAEFCGFLLRLLFFRSAVNPARPIPDLRLERSTARQAGPIIREAFAVLQRECGSSGVRER